jgi:hypothetical protein
MKEDSAALSKHEVVPKLRAMKIYRGTKGIIASLSYPGHYMEIGAQFPPPGHFTPEKTASGTH